MAGGIAGGCGEFVGLGIQPTNLENVLAAALRTNRETAARLEETQGREWRRIAMGRHDIRRFESQLKRPNLLGVAPVTEDQHCDFRSRISEKGKQDKISTKNEDQLGMARNESSWNATEESGHRRGNPNGNRDRDNYRKKKPRGGPEDDWG